MEFTGDQIIEKYGKHYMHCKLNSLLPHEYEKTWPSSGYIVMKWKNELTKVKPKNNINVSYYTEKKIFCICFDNYSKYDIHDKRH